VVDTVPKPLVVVAGQPFLYWVTSWLVRQGVLDIVFSAGHLGDQIERWVATLRFIEHVRALSKRERSPLGTGGAVLACLDECQELVLVVNGDTLLLADLAPLVIRFRADLLDGLILAVPVADASRFGTVEFGDDGLLRSFGEKEPGAGLVNGGVYLFRRAVLQRFLPVRRISLELDLLPDLLADGARIGVAALECPFLDIGIPETLATAGDFVTANRVQLVGLGL
jgi:D-glycero-alpha-D-manno-heptose 1-phosphate guanylyltransferase